MKVIECIYKGEDYSVRDTGEVFRHSRAGKKPRPYDNQWTFGKQNFEKGYMEIASVSVHRIVATAFHGEAPSTGHVVDHKDTNKCNNRPENLRWATKLENIMLNPITVKKIEYVIGCKVEEFLADPAKFRDRFQDQNFTWMRSVSAEEGQRTLKRLEAWAKSDKMPKGGKLGDWIYNRRTWWDQPQESVDQIVVSKTPGAVQRNWKTVSEFPCCPQGANSNPLKGYVENLTPGSVFCRNQYGASIVVSTELLDSGGAMFVITESKDGIKPWALAKVTYEEGVFAHESMGTFFEERGAERCLCEVKGLEWTGEEGIDDWS